MNTVHALPAAAVDTTVSTKICNTAAPSTASIFIAAPENDSVVTSGNVTLSGTLQDVSQIDITIDSNYSQTVAIATGQTSFSLPLTLPQGTHTIGVTGIDICNIADPTDAVVVTYEQGTSGSNGGDVPTKTGASNNTPGVGTPTGGPIENDWVSDVPLVPQALAIIRETGRTLDFDQLSKDGILKAIARFAFFTLGAGLVLFGPFLLRHVGRRAAVNEAVAQYVQGGESGKHAGVSHRHSGGVLRGAGVSLIFLTFLI